MKEIINYEVKSRCVSTDTIEKKLLDLGADFKGLDHQVDTYFNVGNGRLKIREGTIENALIYYNRENKAESRESEITFEKLDGETSFKQILLNSIGAKTVIDKQRKIFFINNVKFHIDIVNKLGEFVEIEAIDSHGNFTKDELKAQCDNYINILALKKKDFIKYSYSDLILENFEQKLRREAQDFLRSLCDIFSKLKINTSFDAIDHLCYRVTSLKEYESHKKAFSKFSNLLIESKIGGRDIATYKLDNPIIWNEHAINVIELPSPKLHNKYALGFEHAEFVIEDSFQKFINQNSSIEFKTSEINKKINPDIRIEFDSGESVKFHHCSLEKVIIDEKSVL